MAERLREAFVNPYIDESSNEARFSPVVTLDEMQERWRRGSWQADYGDFELSPSFFDDEHEPPPVKADTVGQLDKADGESENRFVFDLKKDIIRGDNIYLNLDDSAYTDSYRPQGNIGSSISNITLDRLRYNALADIKEDLPEDLGYLYGTGAEKRVKAREKSKDRLYNRLDSSIDKRRAKVDQMIPQKCGETPEMIMADVKKRREIEDAKSGIVRKPKVKRHSGIYDPFAVPGSIDEFSDYDAQNQYDIERLTGRGSWRGELPVQDGLVPDSRSTPYFGRFSRTWSKIDSLEPSRTELLRHTVNTIYDDNDAERSGNRKFRSNAGSRREYYVSDMDFDPYDRYRRLRRQRRRLSASKNVLSDSIMSGEFNNPYVQISGDRLKSIINHDMRGPGQSAEPEGLTDPALLYEWNMGYSRVNMDDNKYSQWLEQQGKLAEQAEQSRYRGSHRTGRPGAYMQREKPYGEARRYPRGEYNEREARRRDMQEQMQRATEKGIADGREMLRMQQEADRRTERERIRRQQMQQSAAHRKREKYYRQQQEQALKRQQEFLEQQHEQELKRRQELYKKQREQAVKQQQEYYRRQQEYLKRQQAQMNVRQPEQGNYPQVNVQQPPQGYYHQMNAQQPPQSNYPQMNEQQPPQGYYPQMNAQQPPQGYYPQMNGQQPQQGSYPQPNGQNMTAQNLRGFGGRS